MNLDLIPTEARDLLPAFVEYNNTANWAGPKKPPQLNLEEVGDWGAESWADFLDYLHGRGGKKDQVQPLFETLKLHVPMTYESYDRFRDYCGEWEFTLEHLTFVASAENLIDFIRFHEWDDERIKDRVIDLICKLSPTPTQWVKDLDYVFEDRDMGNLQLMAAHWQATEATLEEWTTAVEMLNRSSETSAVDPEILLLRGIAIEKMRKIVRKDQTFKKRRTLVLPP